MKPRLVASLAATALAALAVLLWRPSGPEPVVAGSYAGRATCVACHEPQARLWTGSHHDLAMQEPTAGQLLGDFRDATFTHRGVTTTFHRRGGEPRVRTEGTDGALTDYRVLYAFGAEPLQQLLLPLDDGRLQAFGVAWDSRPADRGGQRWFHLYPESDTGPGSRLHWTRPLQSWNGACSECHSTGLRKGFDVATRSYRTSWSEIDVSCEACHGPGSRHVAIARGTSGGAEPDDWGLDAPLRDQGRVWNLAPGADIAVRGQPLTSRVEIETCARCHSRRATVAEPWLPGQPLLETHLPSLLREGLYHPDGQILDEVYVYGSFAQSRMYAAGVTCSDCHDPHGLAPREEGNTLCTRCHRPQRYDVPSHHFHEPGSAGARCVECHMPATTYMRIDPRRDHSLRVPRPDLTLSLGVPNGCNGCHVQESASWAEVAVRRWYGPREGADLSFAGVFAAARRGRPDAFESLGELASDATRPAIVRATALSLFSGYRRALPHRAITSGLADPDPLVRVGALQGLGGLPPSSAAALAARLGSDPVRAVRVEAGRILARHPTGAGVPSLDVAGAQGALTEYERVLGLNADQAASWVSMGDLYANQGRAADAETAYRTALALDALEPSAYLNLADLQRAMGRDDLAEGTLSAGLAAAPDLPELLHALGLLRVRQGELGQALEPLGRARAARPDQARWTYVHGVALWSAGDTVAGLEVLEQGLEAHPWDPELLAALAAYNRELGRTERALAYARRLLEATPEDPAARELVASLEGAGGGRG